MQKSPNAFRSISEAADLIGTKTHVLRFWESKFSAIKPVKRGDGRRYYRPKDIQLIRGIKKLLHDDGLTVKSVQRIIAQEGANHVIALGTEQVESPVAAGVDTTPPQQEVFASPAPPPPPPTKSAPAPVLSYDGNVEDPDHEDQFLLFHEAHFEKAPEVRTEQPAKAEVEAPPPIEAKQKLPQALQNDRAVSDHTAQHGVLSAVLGLSDAERSIFAQKHSAEIAKLKAILL